MNLWYLQTLKYTTQDQVGFSYVCQKTKTIPYTLPNNEIFGLPHKHTMFYIKHEHHYNHYNQLLSVDNSKHTGTGTNVDFGLNIGRRIQKKQ